MSLQIIGLSGYARSGKDLVAKSFDARGFQKFALADQIRASLYALNPLVSESKRLSEAINDYGWETAKTAFPEIRHLLQRLGSEVGRELFDEDFWVTMTFRNIPERGRFVISDCRFPNEAERIKSLGGQMWRVNKPGLQPDADAHKSETALDDYAFDHILTNDGEYPDLDTQVGQIISLDPFFLSGHERIDQVINDLLDAGLEY